MSGVSDYKKLIPYMVPYLTPSIDAQNSKGKPLDEIQGIVTIALMFSAIKYLGKPSLNDKLNNTALAIEIAQNNINATKEELYTKVLEGLYIPYFESFKTYEKFKRHFSKIEVIAKSIKEMEEANNIKDNIDLTDLFELIRKEYYYRNKSDEEIMNLETLVIMQPIQKLPRGFDRLKNLKNLTLTRTFLTDLPQELEKLNLESLSIANGRFRSIPEVVFQMKNLKSLDLSQNPIDLEGIGRLRQLRELTLRNIGFYGVPEELGNLKNLEKLVISGNKLKEIPDSIFELRNLKKLQINANEIVNVSSRIGELSNLEELNLSYNVIENLPTEMTKLRKLENLNLLKNDQLKSQTFGIIKTLEQQTPNIRILF